MKRRDIAVLLVLLASTATGAVAESAVRGRFSFKWDGAPIWISAGEALNPDGSVRPGVLDEFQRDELQRRRELLRAQRRSGISTQDVRDCDVEFVGYLAEGGDPGVETFEALRELAMERTVISGTVAGSDVGIHYGMPHTVLRIESDSAGTIYVIVPYGQLRLDGMTVCNADPLYSEPAAVGDAITVIVSKPLDETGALYWPAGSSILYEHEGVLVAAPFLRDDPALHRFTSLEALTAALCVENCRRAHGRACNHTATASKTGNSMATAAAFTVAAMRTASCTWSSERPPLVTTSSCERMQVSQALMALTARQNSSKSTLFEAGLAMRCMRRRAGICEYDSLPIT